MSSEKGETYEDWRLDGTPDARGGVILDLMDLMPIISFPRATEDDEANG